MGEIDLQGIAAERTIAYETAKGKIRDLKKLLNIAQVNKKCGINIVLA